MKGTHLCLYALDDDDELKATAVTNIMFYIWQSPASTYLLSLSRLEWRRTKINCHIPQLSPVAGPAQQNVLHGWWLEQSSLDRRNEYVGDRRSRLERCLPHLQTIKDKERQFVVLLKCVFKSNFRVEGRKEERGWWKMNIIVFYIYISCEHITDSHWQSSGALK